MTIDGREERGDRTREALLLAGRRVFARRGYGAASVRDLAGEAAVNPALVAYHFGSKEGLWKAVVDEAMAGLRHRILGALGGAGGRDAARRVLGAYVDHLAEDPDVPRLIQRALLDGDPHVTGITAAHLRPLLQALGARSIWRSPASVAGSSAASAPDGVGEPTKRGAGGLEPAGPPGARGGSGEAEEAAISLFGAAVAPVLYASVLADLRGEDPLSDAALARRRVHLDALVDLVVSHLESA